jgi:hypothetical protein
VSAPAAGRRWIAALACLALLGSGAARAQSEQPRFSVRVDPPSGEVGLLMTLLVGVEGAVGADCHLVETPPVSGGRLSLAQAPSTQQSTVVVNGRITRSVRTEWAFRLVPERAGTLSVPPLRFNCRGEEVSTAPITVEVGPSSIAAGAVTLELRPSAGALWAGQTFQLDVVASIDEPRVEQLVKNGLELDLPWLEGLPGLLRLDTQPPSGDLTAVRLTGRREALEMRVSRDLTANRIVLTRTLDMLATSSGPIELPDSLFSATLAVETGPDRNDPFGRVFGGSLAVTRAVVVDARATGVTLDVRAPPLEGRPRSFTNAVGRFRFNGTAAPQTLRVGDTCTLSLTLTGEGNLDFVEWPAFDELSRDFRVFGKNERKLPRTRVLEIQVSPKTQRVTEVPRLEISAFDPEQERYETLSTGPFELTVSPGGEQGLTLESRAETLSNLETIREELPEPAGPRVPGWAWWAPAALLLVVADARRRRLAWRARNPRLLRRKGARAALDASLAGAADAHAVCVAFSRFLSARLDGPPAGLTAVEAGQRLQDPALGDALRRSYARWEAGAIGGAPLDLAAARREAAELADRVEAAT